MHQHVSVCESPSPLAYRILFRTEEWILPRLGGNVSEVRLQVHKVKRVEQTRSQAVDHKHQTLMEEWRN